MTAYIYTGECIVGARKAADVCPRLFGHPTPCEIETPLYNRGLQERDGPDIDVEAVRSSECAAAAWQQIKVANSVCHICQPKAEVLVVTCTKVGFRLSC